MARILVVDDNFSLAENVAEILEEMGHKAKAFEHPLLALAQFEPGRYDAAILDYRMPELNGVELYCRLREKEPTLPALIISAFADHIYTQEALSRGVKIILSKPVGISTLLEKVSSLVDITR